MKYSATIYNYVPVSNDHYNGLKKLIGMDFICDDVKK